MSKDLNKVLLTGRLGRDTELRVTPGGNPVATFSVASNRPVKQADGSWTDQTEWFRVVAWDKLAERCAEQLTKGRHVLIEGRLQTRDWVDRQGQKRFTTEVIASNMLTLDKKPGTEGGGLTDRPENGWEDSDVEEEDIPF